MFYVPFAVLMLSLYAMGWICYFGLAFSGEVEELSYFSFTQYRQQFTCFPFNLLVFSHLSNIF
jgi:hypothetical protein